MKIVIAMMKHETNSFSPLKTDWKRFCEWSGYLDGAARDAFEGTKTAMGAFIDLARDAGAEIVTPIAAESFPSGPVEAETYEFMCDRILKSIAEGCDAAMLDLHGAMVAEGAPDGEGALLARIRALRPDLPIAVALDQHANVTAAMTDNCTVMTGFQTYPHIDIYETGERAGRILLDFLAGGTKPVTVHGARPILAQTLRMGHVDEPMRSLLAMARAEEAADPRLDISVMGGFPMSDTPDAGFSVIAVDRMGDRARAQAAADRILDVAWARRDEFIYQHRPLQEAVAQAKSMTEGPILLLDHADNCGSGGTQDVMTVIAELIEQGLEGVAVATVRDPQAVKEMAAAGVGAQVTLALGGRTDMPSIGLSGKPLVVTGKVRTLTDGEWTIRGPMYTGTKVHMGPTAVLDTGKMQIVITSLSHEPWDAGVFRSVGIEPTEQRYLLLKSRIHYRAGFEKMGKATLTLDGDGVTTSDNSKLTFTRLRRPIYPLDRINEA
ncbi:MAG: M81 family metallopeptidase [Elsteraceae bacterium]